MVKIKIFRALFNESTFGEAGYIEDLTQKIEDAQGDDIELVVNSPGGSVSDGYAIINSLVAHNGNITMNIVGEASSMASAFLPFANHSTATEFSQIMLHKAYTSNETKEAQNSVMAINEQIATAFINKGVNSDLINKIFGEGERLDYWFTANEAKECGLIDEVIPQEIKTKVAYSIIDKYYTVFGDAKNKIIYNKKEVTMFDTKEKKELESKLAVLQDELVEQTNKFETVTAENETLKAEKEVLDNEIAEYNKEKVEAEAEQVEAEETESNEIARLENLITSNKEAIDNISAKVDELLATLSQSTTAFKVEKVQYGSKIVNLNGLDNEIAKINKGIK